MAISGVSNNAGSTQSTSASSVDKGLGKDEVFKLLLTQLQYQDPLNPMDKTELIAQLAQFSALEKLQSLDDNMALMLEMEQLGQASGLIGKEIEASVGNGGETVKGVVTAAKMEDGGAVLSVGSRSVKLSEVVSVSEQESMLLAQASNLIKMEVKARSSETGETISGIVDSVEMKDGKVYLKVDGQSVKLDDVIFVSEGEKES